MGRIADACRGWIATRRSVRDPASVLWMAWCGAMLAHYDDRMHWGVAPVFTASAILCGLGVCFARSPVIVMAAAITQICAWWHHMPSIDNHWTFAAAVNMALVLSIVVRVIEDRRVEGGFRVRPLDDAWLERTAPMIRLLVITMYFFAVFHKLNWGFFDPDLSCALHFYRRAANADASIPLPTDLDPQARLLVIYGVFALEAAIAVGLAFRRTWWIGVAAGLFFHITTALFMRHFPALMFALYFVFLPPKVRTDAIALMERLARRLTAGRLGFVAMFWVQAAWFSAVTLALHHRVQVLDIDRGVPESGYIWVLRTWQIFAIAVAGTLTVAVIRSRGWRRSNHDHLLLRGKWQILIPALFFVNCMAPYLGFKVSTSVAMWSNLVTAGEVSNHLLIPGGAIEVFPYTSDLVEIEASSDKELRKLARREFVPYYQLRAEVRRAAKRRRPVRLVYHRDGQRIVLERADEDPELMARPPYVLRKLVKVKSVRKDGRAVCTW